METYGEAKFQDLSTWRDSSLFTEAERAALEYAERITITTESVDDALVQRLKTLYTEAQIVELTAAIALENFRSKFNPALGIEAQGFCLIAASVTCHRLLVTPSPCHRTAWVR